MIFYLNKERKEKGKESEILLVTGNKRQEETTNKIKLNAYPISNQRQSANLEKERRKRKKGGEPVNKRERKRKDKPIKKKK